MWTSTLWDVRHLRRRTQHQPKPWDRRSHAGHPWHRFWRNLAQSTWGRAKRREWRALKNYFNGYLAEHPTAGTRCGHGWTKARALRDLDQHLRNAGAS
jgi:hypothetical protein